MKKILGLLLTITALVGCSDESNSAKDNEGLTKSFVEEYAEIGLSYDDVRERFGEEELSEVVGNTETWLYNDTSKEDFDYEKTFGEVVFDEFKSGDVDAQLYITFTDEKASMYTYFYLGEDNKVWQYQILPDAEPLDIPKSN
ncbi:PhoU family transcriptional regulator [Solibacillus sp. FSL R7-0682]|uniref:PhoU family transcriptional regulator n=1 Tax=Solibacillus sp. FSL R7-0682 TaxID=2921690 RepID=UPI0030F74361